MAAPEQRLPFEIDSKPREACGIVGVYAPEGDAVRIAHEAISTLNHRGQDGWGYSYVEQNGISTVETRKYLGLVAAEIEYPADPAAEYNFATAHARYGTVFARDPYSALQPKNAQAKVTVAHNGQFRRGQLDELAAERGLKAGDTDTDTFAVLLGSHIEESGHIEPAFHQLLPKLKGAFSLTILSEDAIYAVRDRHGIRPLVRGAIEKTGAIVVASEVGALNEVGAEFDIKTGEIKPGTYAVIDSGGIRSVEWADTERKVCLFEKTYLSKPQNIIEGQLVEDYRSQAGSQLAELSPVDADLVVPVLGSAKFYARGYSETSEIDYSEGALSKNKHRKNPESDRTFIATSQEERELAVRDKFSVEPGLVRDKRLVLVDDSLVRGTTMRIVISMLKEAGASEVHVRIGSDRYVRRCEYGVNVQTEDELLATGKTLSDMQKAIGADSLAFLPLKDMRQIAISGDSAEEDYCDGCMGGKYADPLEEVLGKQQVYA